MGRRNGASVGPTGVFVYLVRYRLITGEQLKLRRYYAYQGSQVWLHAEIKKSPSEGFRRLKIYFKKLSTLLTIVLKAS